MLFPEGYSYEENKTNDPIALLIVYGGLNCILDPLFVGFGVENFRHMRLIGTSPKDMLDEEWLRRNIGDFQATLGYKPDFVVITEEKYNNKDVLRNLSSSLELICVYLEYQEMSG